MRPRADRAARLDFHEAYLVACAESTEVGRVASFDKPSTACRPRALGTGRAVLAVTGQSGRPPVGTELYGLRWMAAAGNFVPEIVPGRDDTLEALAPSGQTSVMASVAETVAKVGVAGSNPVVRSSAPGQGLRRTRTMQSIGHKSQWDWLVHLGMASHVVGLESPIVPTAFVPQA